MVTDAAESAAVTACRPARRSRITRSAIAAAQDQVAGSPAALRIAPTRYNLGISRGYERFAQPAVLDQKLSSERLSIEAPVGSTACSISRKLLSTLACQVIG